MRNPCTGSTVRIAESKRRQFLSMKRNIDIIANVERLPTKKKATIAEEFQIHPSIRTASMKKKDKLVSWCFEPSQPQRITSGLNTNFTLSPSYSFHKSSYHRLFLFLTYYVPRALNKVICIRQGDLFYSSGLHRNHVLATANTGEIGRGFGKKCR